MRDPQASATYILSLLSTVREIQMNATEHGVSLLTTISDAGSTPAASTRTIVADGDVVILHGRYSGLGLPLIWIVADIVRMKDGILVEHWDVIQDEATRESSKSGLPMFCEKFGG